MLQLLKIEWLKIKNYTAFIVLGLFFVLGVAGGNYAVYSIKKNVIDKNDPTGLISGTSLYDFSHTWQTTSYVGGSLLLLPALLLIMLVTNEFGYRTHRQNIIDGWSRKDFINVKIALAFIVALVSTILVFITAVIFGFASGTPFSSEHFDALAFFFLKALSYNMIALVISVLVRKTGFAIGLFFVYMWFENFLSGLLQALSFYLKGKKDFDIGNMGDYLPMNASDALLKFPDNPVSGMTKNAPGMPHDYTHIILMLALFYLLVFFVWSRNRIIKTDL